MVAEWHGKRSKYQLAARDHSGEFLNGLSESVDQIVDISNQFGPLAFRAMLLLVFVLLSTKYLGRLLSRLLIRMGVPERRALFPVTALHIAVLMAAALVVLNMMGFPALNLFRFLVAAAMALLALFIILKPYLPGLPLKEGDVVSQGSIFGTVERITFAHTMIRSIDGTAAFVPNHKMLNEPLVNLSTHPHQRADVEFFIPYDEDVEAVRAIVSVVLRPIIPDAGPENLAKAAEFAKRIKVYPLADADNPPKNNYVDIYGKLNEMTPVLDGGVFAEIHEILQEEVVEEQNMAMMGLLARIGIKKGEPFKPDAKAQAVFDKAGPDALQYMLEQYHRFLNPWMYEGKLWSTLTPAGDIETDWSYEFPSYFDYHARGALYYAIITSVKNYGTATFYLDLAETPNGDWLDGSKSYKLVVPPNVPVRDFWAVTVYDLETASYVREMSKSSVDSNQPDLRKNSDGSVDVYFGPEARAGKEANWIPTKTGRRFFLLFRFYGPESGVFDGSFELNDIKLID